MIFKKITIKNIRSYQEQEIEIPVGSVLIAGDIGSGKTTLLLAIEYALFGLQAGQKGSSLLRNSAESGEVALELEIDGREVVIERGLKRTSKGVSNDYAAITIEGEKYESSVTEIKSKIIELLGYPSEFIKRNNVLYKYTVHTPQEQMKQIMLDDAESRINVLRHIFGMDRYKKMKDNLSILLLHINNNTKIIQGEIKTLEFDKEVLESRKLKFGEVEGKIQARSEEHNNKKTDREKIEAELAVLRKKIDEKKTFESEIEKTKILIATKRESMASLVREADELRKEIEESVEQFNNETYNSILDSLESQKAKFETLNSVYHKLISDADSFQREQISLLDKNERIFKIDICPTCLQDVSDTHKHNILNEAERSLSKIKKEIDYLNKESGRVLLEINKVKTEVARLEDEKLKMEIQKSRTRQIAKAKEKFRRVKDYQTLLEKDMSLLSSHMNSLKEKVLNFSHFEYQLKRVDENFKQALLEEKNSEILAAELKKEKELLNDEIILLKQTIEKKDSSKQSLRQLEKLVGWLSFQFLNLIETIERTILLKLRKEFSQFFRKWFQMLVPDNSLESQIDENFTPLIMQGETEMDYSFLSGGERTAVALAYRLALNQTINSMMSRIKTQGAIILDEPTDGFSESQIEKIRDILDELSMKQVIIVSHEHKIEGFVDNLIRISKEGDVSTASTLTQAKYQKT